MDMSKITFRVGFEGCFGEFQTDPRNLGANSLSQMVSLDGIVTSCCLVRPKLARSVHYSEQRGTFLTREYRDVLMTGGSFLPQNTTNNSYPTQDAEGNRLETEYGLCTYRDHQKIIIQEMPERAPPGQLPRSVEVVLMEDLVDSVKPGDRVRVMGINKGLGYIGNNGQPPSLFKSVIVANNIKKVMGRDTGGTPMLTDVDVQNIKAISKRPDLFSLLSRSLAPSIYGHAYVKKALLLLLLGGVERIVGDGNTHIRGYVRILYFCNFKLVLTN